MPKVDQIVEHVNILGCLRNASVNFIQVFFELSYATHIVGIGKASDPNRSCLKIGPINVFFSLVANLTEILGSQSLILASKRDNQLSERTPVHGIILSNLAPIPC